MNLGIILLAAGGSTRMGEPKQLLQLQGESLIRRALTTSLQTPFRPVVVVLGASAEGCSREIAGLEGEVIVNPEWQRGMGSSIRLGVAALVNRDSRDSRHQIDGVLILLHDQILLTANHLMELAELWTTSGAQIVAARYGDVIGTPAIFSRGLFDELLNLPDPAGARKVIHSHLNLTQTIDLPEAAFDVDTPQDYQHAVQQLGSRQGRI